MQLLPHIDIIEPERIAALLADERNFCWRAVDSEGLDGWTPDLGISGYPRPSVVRPASVAAAGLPSTLRHRFWQTVQDQADHTGPRYIGVVIYLPAGEPSPLILRLRGQDIGRIEPTRLDNRLHLLVADVPVDFIGEMEIFNLVAPGKGSYRIEHVLLLKDRPEPSSFAPEIENLTHRLFGRKTKGEYHVEFHFVTSSVCEAQIEYEELNNADPRRKRHEKTQVSSGRLHQFFIANLFDDQEFQATVTARDISGQTTHKIVQFSTESTEDRISEEIAIPIELMNTGTTDLVGMPLRFGVPLARAKGDIYDPELCFIDFPDVRQSASVNYIHSFWDDRSLRWVIIEANVPASLKDSRSLTATLRLNPHDEPSRVSMPLLPVAAWTELQLARFERVGREGQPIVASSDEEKPNLYLLKERDNYHIKEHFRGRRIKMSISDWQYEAVLSNGMRLSPRIVVEPHPWESPRRRGLVRYTVDHQDEFGIAHLRSTIRLQFYPDQSFVKIHHRLEVISPALAAAAAGGDIPPECSADMRANIVGESGEESTLLKLRSFSLHIPFAGIKSLRHGDEEWRVGGWSGKSWQLRHDHDLAHTINGEERDRRALGHIRVEGDAGSLGVGVRNFWQTYPKALSVGSAGIDIQLFPDRRGVDLPGDEDAWHRLYFWLDDDGYKLKSGLALSSEILLDFGADDPRVFDWLENPILVRPDIDYLNSTGALNAIGPRAGSPLPRYEELADIAMQSFFDDQEHYRAYGHVNYGDWYGESAWSWGNNEYDPAYVGYSEFLRGGEPGWALWAADAARHLADVDTVNFSRDASEIGGQAMHIPGHLGGYLPPYFRSKMKGTSLGPAHMWVEGQLLHYLLTGDQIVYDSLLKTKDWLIQPARLDYYDYKSARDSGWHLIHLSMLALVLDDPDCLNAAAIIVERVLERRTPGGGWDRMLGEPHCGCGYPRCSGEAGFMICILVSGLKRYHHLTGDPAVAEAIIGGARWLINQTFDHDSGHFRYTSCPNRSLGGTFQCTQWALEALAAAWELSGDPEIGAYLKRGLPVIGQYPARLSHLGVGKAMSQQMRYVPTILASLAKRPL
ncbi:MAG: hypothetical protein F4X02_04275 [Chloroflexi bacterium]|nr:hypothetical protein [Chloroflexota bacterium]